MLRLFIIIISAVLITVFAALNGVNFLSEKLLSHYEKPFYANSFNGVFALLDYEIKDSPEANLERIELALQSQFRFPLYLRKQSELVFDEAALKKIDAGSMHVADIDGADFLYQKSQHHDRIWELAAEFNNYDKNVAIVIGPMELILARLDGHTLVEQQDLISTLAQDFGFPITLESLESYNFTADEEQQLSANLVIARGPGKNGERYYKLVPDSTSVVKLGPIPFPSIIKFIQPLIIGLFIVLLTLTSFLWLAPLWRDLRRLISTSDLIAGGKLEARVQSATPSMIKPVLEGFNHMAEQTQNMIASQQALTNAVSHELRTPLARLKFSLEIASQTNSENLRSRHHEEMNRDITELNQMVDELLTFARYDQIDSDFDLDQLPDIRINQWIIDQVNRSKRNKPNDCTVSYNSTVPDDEHARFHARLMAYAISNGLGNAIRYAQARVLVKFHKQDSEYILQIDDDGPGIAEENRELLFEPFRRVDESRSRDSGGFGLGLSIVSKVASLHQGRAQILDSDFGGARLQLNWPIMK